MSDQSEAGETSLTSDPSVAYRDDDATTLSAAAFELIGAAIGDREVPSNDQQWVELAGDDASIFIAIEHDGHVEKVGELDWHSYEKKSQLLAWEMAHGVLLRELQRLTRQILRAKALLTTNPAGDNAKYTADLLQEGNGQKDLHGSSHQAMAFELVANERHTSGVIQTMQTMLRKIASSATSTKRHGSHEDPDRRDQLLNNETVATGDAQVLTSELSVELLLNTFYIGCNELQAFQAGDLMISGVRAQSPLPITVFSRSSSMFLVAKLKVEVQQCEITLNSTSWRYRSQFPKVGVDRTTGNNDEVVEVQLRLFHETINKDAIQPGVLCRQHLPGTDVPVDILRNGVFWAAGTLLDYDGQIAIHIQRIA